jgi:hypothetical protein
MIHSEDMKRNFALFYVLRICLQGFKKHKTHVNNSHFKPALPPPPNQRQLKIQKQNTRTTNLPSDVWHSQVVSTHSQMNMHREFFKTRIKLMNCSVGPSVRLTLQVEAKYMQHGNTRADT